MELTHLIQLKQIALILCFGWFAYLIREKLKGKWFEDSHDRDGTLIMGAVVGLNLFMLISFGNKLSGEVLAGIAIGFSQAVLMMVAFYYKQNGKKSGG